MPEGGMRECARDRYRGLGRQRRRLRWGGQPREGEGTSTGFSHEFRQQHVCVAAVSEKELAQQPLNTEETAVFENFVERKLEYTGFRYWTGWYPSLFYTNYMLPISDKTQSTLCDVWDPVVTDVHTDAPDAIVGDPGAVIHEAVGNPHTLLIAIDDGADKAVYAGPVFSHYEFETGPSTRLSDAEWKARLLTQKPQRATWTRPYLPPGFIQVPATYRR